MEILLGTLTTLPLTAICVSSSLPGCVESTRGYAARFVLETRFTSITV